MIQQKNVFCYNLRRAILTLIFYIVSYTHYMNSQIIGFKFQST